MDEDESSAVVAQTAVAVLRVANEVGEEDEGQAVTPQDRVDATFHCLRVAERAARIALRWGPEFVGYLRAEINSIPASEDTRRMFHERIPLKRLWSFGDLFERVTQPPLTLDASDRTGGGQ
jgi:hypothetical protein